jgi:hypothetical protein
VTNAISVYPDTTHGVSGSGDVIGDIVEVQIVLQSPASNPWKQGDEIVFDRPPFDMWIYVTNTSQSTHIYDPDANGENYFFEGQVVSSNYPVLQGVFLFLGISVVLANLAADVVYGFLDPRVRR